MSASRPDQGTPLATRVAAGVMAVQALVLLGLVVFGAVLMFSPGAEASRLALWEILILALVILLFLLSRALRQGRGWARSGTVAWNLLFLPVGWQMLNPAWMYSGVVVLALAVVGLAAALMMPPPRSMTRD